MNTRRGGCCFNRRYICERVIVTKAAKTIRRISCHKQYRGRMPKGCAKIQKPGIKNSRVMQWSSAATKFYAIWVRDQEQIKETLRCPQGGDPNFGFTGSDGLCPPLLWPCEPARAGCFRPNPIEGPRSYAPGQPPSVICHSETS